METVIPYVAGGALVLGVIYRLVRYENVGASTVSVGLIALVAIALPTFQKISLNLTSGEITLDQCEEVLVEAPADEARETVLRVTDRKPDLKIALKKDFRALRIPQTSLDPSNRLRLNPDTR